MMMAYDYMQFLRKKINIALFSHTKKSITTPALSFAHHKKIYSHPVSIVTQINIAKCFFLSSTYF